VTPPPAPAVLDADGPARRGLAAVAATPPGVAVFESKLRAPALRAGLVSRAGLVNRLRAARALRLATLVAPAGYGKTTLLAQWAARDERPFVWLSVDARDNDPLLFLRHLAAAFDRAEPLDAAVLDALEASDHSVWEDAAPRLTAALTSRRPFVAVLDDVDAIRRGDSADLVAAVADHVPAASMLVLAARSAPAVPIARLRASGRLLELGADDLALSRRDSLLLVRAAGTELDDERASDLAARSEGWAAGLYLATRALDDAGPSARTVVVGGDDRFLADYFWSEHLSRLGADRLAFLRRTSVLERLSGELCDAVLEREGSALELAAIARAGLFLVPLDRQGGWYRYHRFFRDALRRELEQHEPSLAPGLHIRAANWLEAHGDPEAALVHARASGDTGRAGRILTTIGLPGAGAGPATVERWLDSFAGGGDLQAQPAVAALGAWVHALRGRPEDAERWLAGAGPDAADGALVRAALCSGGVRQMGRDADDAVAGLPAESPWGPTALLLGGVARALQDQRDDADTTFAAAAEAAQRRGETDADALATAERALLAATAGDQSAAERLALRAREVAAADPSDGHVGRALAHAVAARALLRRGRWDEARQALETADGLGGPLSHALPWLAVQVRVELGAAHVTLRDRSAAAAQLEECERILEARPNLGSLPDAVADLRRQLDGLPAGGDGHGTGLTGAELRLLPLLATHLSFREIGERLYVSRNTIKTQAISAYRKLGVSSRSAAIGRAGELGLIDAGESVAGEFIRRG
jgi:LuxR family maltose regulon positive regulatory protein